MSELLASDFIARRRDGDLRLALVGMSGIGKSYWARLLADNGFLIYDCDAAIETELRLGQLLDAGSGIASVAKWMGQPYDPRFLQTQETYLELEAQAAEHGLNMLTAPEAKSNFVLDTTGSVVHLGQNILERMKRLTTVIYLSPTNEAVDAMFQNYLEEPKPVVWGERYSRRDDETDLESLRRLYPELFAYRRRMYEQLSDVVVPTAELEGIISATGFLDVIERCVKRVK